MSMFDRLYPPLDWQAVRHEWPHSACSQFVRTADMRWHVQRMGQGPVLLLLHGTGASTHSWRDVMPRLATHFTVLAVDLPGHGFSSALQGDAPSLPTVARALQHLLAQLQLRPQVWMGHSAGAAVAARAVIDQLAHRPADAAELRVVALNPAWLPLPGAAQWLFPLAAWFIARNPLAGWLASRHASDPEAVQRLIARTGSHVDARGLAGYAHLLRQPAHVRGVLQLMAAWDLQRFSRDLPQLRCPVLVQVGLADRTVPPEQAEDACAHLPDAHCQRLAGLGHLAHEEAPAVCVQGVMDWLAARGSASPA